MVENVWKIKIKLENIWIDLIRSIYAPYNVVVSTYTSVSVTKGFRVFTDQKIIPVGL